MASVNKESLREEFGALKERFGRLRADGKITAESSALFEALLMLVQVLMAVFMEKNTPEEQHQLEQTGFADAEGRHRAHPARHPRQGQGAQRDSLGQYPYRGARGSLQGQLL